MCLYNHTKGRWHLCVRTSPRHSSYSSQELGKFDKTPYKMSSHERIVARMRCNIVCRLQVNYKCKRLLQSFNVTPNNILNLSKQFQNTELISRRGVQGRTRYTGANIWYFQ
ncbi:hypothetical protein TNCT_457041 [Trichonephila clavata]|uniref:Uncharacterized protein n=1 Tax=Trichonephila clavata TaxID=2740835 RepID=A0A8X6KVX5_TRICU|nr:hypothetical protein TNCT_457041 [Trichonephila clavata]